MSTVHYGARELANIVRVITDRSAHLPEHRANAEEGAAAALALYSIVNTKAYNTAYPHLKRATPATKNEIVHASRLLSRPSLYDALRTYQLLDYNADDCMTDEVAAAIQVVGGVLAGIAADHLERLKP